MTTQTDGLAAWRSLIGSPEGRWSETAAGLSLSPARIVHAPKFRLDRTDAVFCMGSCFARNIEEHLIYAGVPVSSKRIVCPKVEWPTRPNAVVNKFTTRSMANELDWVIHGAEVDEGWFEETSSGWVDLQLGPDIRPVALERAIERRRYLTGDYFSRLRRSAVVVLTLGLNEVWLDRATGRHLNASPSFASIRREPARYALRVTDAAENLAELEAIRTALKALSPEAKIIVTVSPVPMSATFSGRDVIVANTYSKSVLRTAADVFAAAFDDVDYFPSYEMVMNGPRDVTFAGDRLHVRDAAVGGVMRQFTQSYYDEVLPAPDFVELGYLSANPDVEEAVRRGEFESGFEHWRSYGEKEGRPLMPEGGASWMMQAVHL